MGGRWQFARRFQARCVEKTIVALCHHHTVVLPSHTHLPPRDPRKYSACPLPPHPSLWATYLSQQAPTRHCHDAGVRTVAKAYQQVVLRQDAARVALGAGGCERSRRSRRCPLQFRCSPHRHRIARTTVPTYSEDPILRAASTTLPGR